MHYFILFVSTFSLAVICTYLVRKLAMYLQIVDMPTGGIRKIHKKPIPLLGGLAIYLSFFISLGIYYLFFDAFGDTIQAIHLVFLLISSTILMIGGFVDDKYDIGAYSIVFPLIAVLLLVPLDLGFNKITNPFGGVILLNHFKYPLFTWHSATYYFVVFADIFSMLWLMGMTYTTKVLDGLDGLVGGLTAIGAFMMFLLSTTDAYYQPEVATIALVLCAACIGFLVFNFHPASIFLGEGGSVFTGFILGVLAIIAGGKIATALLVMGIPILDMMWVIMRRVRSGKSVVKHDALHMHHRLLYSGLNQRQAVLILYALSFSFGITTLFLQSLQKLFTLGLLIFVMFLLASLLVSHKDRTQKK